MHSSSCCSISTRPKKICDILFKSVKTCSLWALSPPSTNARSRDTCCAGELSTKGSLSGTHTTTKKNEREKKKKTYCEKIHSCEKTAQKKKTHLHGPFSAEVADS